ncbi:hypothetical protein [Martelella endophytica]|uniref:hypothetical protein n=1 Tax=Martelella endophytica TaxID=1486262 RepID=UPI000696A70E|nr:hypothetical protein [Martelella endophytica]
MERFVSLAAAVMSLDGRMLARSARRNAIVAVILLFLLLAAYVSGVAALAIWLSSIYGALGATLVIAIASLTLAILLLIWAMMMNRMEKRRYRAAKYATEEMLQGVFGLVPMMLQEKPITGMGAIAAFAYVLARASMKRRS